MTKLIATLNMAHGVLFDLTTETLYEQITKE